MEGKERALFFIYNDISIISVAEVQGEDKQSITRCIIRDSTGKYAWDCSPSYDSLFPKPQRKDKLTEGDAVGPSLKPKPDSRSVLVSTLSEQTEENAGNNIPGRRETFLSNRRMTSMQRTWIW